MEIILAVVISFVLTALMGKALIPALVKLKVGQSIKEIGPKWHMNKQGIPTMGGLMFIIGIGVTIVILGWRRMMAGSFEHLYVYLFALVFGAIGYIDDYQKVKHHHNTGLTALQKFALQLAAAVAFLCLMRYEGMLSPNLYIPFWNTHIVLPWVVYHGLRRLRHCRYGQRREHHRRARRPEQQRHAARGDLLRRHRLALGGGVSAAEPVFRGARRRPARLPGL